MLEREQKRSTLDTTALASKMPQIPSVLFSDATNFYVYLMCAIAYCLYVHCIHPPWPLIRSLVAALWVYFKLRVSLCLFPKWAAFVCEVLRLDE